MNITQELIEQMISHAQREAPNECCGLMASRGGEFISIHPAENAAASPLRYEIDGAEQYQLQMSIEDAGLELGGIYHSHTRSAPYPSQTDINLAFYPDALYVIVGLAGAEPEVRSFRIRGGQVSEESLQIT